MLLGSRFVTRSVNPYDRRSWGAFLRSLLKVIPLDIKFTANGFGWPSIRDLYVSILEWISSFTVGILRSECIRLLVTNHGAFEIFRSVLDWNLCRISILEFEAVPHSWIPYVQMGLIIHLYINSLFSSERGDLELIRDLNLFSCISRAFLLVCICFFHVSLLSRCIPRYFTSFACGISEWLRVIGGHVSRLRVNVTCTDLVSLTLILQSCSQDEILSIHFWREWLAFLGSSLTANAAVSSANVPITTPSVRGRSEVNNK